MVGLGWSGGHLFSKLILRGVVTYMVNHQQLINNKFLALMSLYGVEERADPDRGWNSPALQAVPEVAIQEGLLG